MQETRHCIPVETLVDHSLVSTIQTILSENGLLSEPQGVAYGTDAFWLSTFGIPSVVWGPGDILQAHSDNEYIFLDQIWLATTMYTEAIMQLCGPS
jgi:acetylornithine deacetylase/succinyl-diaminopimelate desuccinylase-like protein